MNTEATSVLATSRDTAPAYWQVDILWMVLADGSQTGNAYSLLEELCPQGSGPPPHTHTQIEVFYLLEGEVTFLVDGKQITAKAGSMLSIPAETMHSFRVDSETCRLLNMYVPAGFEQSVIDMGSRRKRRRKFCLATLSILTLGTCVMRNASARLASHETVAFWRCSSPCVAATAFGL